MISGWRSVLGELITPRPGPGVCPACFNFTRESLGRCRACRASESHLDAIVPISYAAAGSSLHLALADYKRTAEPAVPYLIDSLAAVLSRFLSQHEACVASAAGVDRFDTVGVVPSSDAHRDLSHPLRRIVGQSVGETSRRFLDALGASGVNSVPHAFDRRRFRLLAPVDGLDVLLIDDVWTTGASAQSAAACLRDGGARSVSAVVIGRYVNGHWGGITERLAQMEHSSSAEGCALCCEGEPEIRRVKSDGGPLHGPPSDGLLTGPRHRPG